MALKFELAAASLRPGYRTNGLVPGENSCSGGSISSWSANCEKIPNAVRSLRTVAAKSIIWRHGAPLVATALCAVLAS